MKRKSLVLSMMLVGLVCAKARSAQTADMFAFQNFSSSFTADADTSGLNRFSVQVNFSTPAVNDAQIGYTDIDTTNDTIFEPSYGFGVGQPVLLATMTAISPTPLVTGTTYYVIRITDNLLKLATTYAQASSGDAIDILSVSTGAWTLRPLPYSAGTVGFFWSASNDAANWTIVNSSQSLVTIGSGYRLFDFGEFPYRFLRFDFRGPNAGVVRLRALLYGKEK